MNTLTVQLNNDIISYEESVADLRKEHTAEKSWIYWIYLQIIHRISIIYLTESKEKGNFNVTMMDNVVDIILLAFQY